MVVRLMSTGELLGFPRITVAKCSYSNSKTTATICHNIIRNIRIPVHILIFYICIALNRITEKLTDFLVAAFLRIMLQAVANTA